jgi:DNA polymerase III delta prime subunit
MTITGLNELFQNYGLTGNPAIDTLILAHIIPLLVSYITLVFMFIKNYLAILVGDYLKRLYDKIKKKMLGTIDIRLCVSEDRSIYPIIKSILFSPDINSDNIDSKTLGMLALMTESKQQQHYYYDSYDCNVHDLYLDSSNNITTEKRMDMGSSISKKYFRFGNYYIVVSENKKTDFIHYYSRMYGVGDEEKKPKEKDDTKECFILFEAIRSNNDIPKDENIITKFLDERFKLKIRIPYKYILRINDDSIGNKLHENRAYANNDNGTGELKISDGIGKFFTNPKVKDFYANKNIGSQSLEKKIGSTATAEISTRGTQPAACGQGKIDKSVNLARSRGSAMTTEVPARGISSSLTVEHKGNNLDANNLDEDLVFKDIVVPNNKANLFDSTFNSIMNYFFCGHFDLKKTIRCYFYFKDNKIIIYFELVGDSKHLCVISFQEILHRSNIIEIIRELVVPQNTFMKSDKISVSTYNGRWNTTECDGRSYDTVYLPMATRKLITSEMEKFICFEQIYKEIGVPYKKGFLLYGPPGTGKTSLAKTLACDYGLPIYIIDVNSELINDESIVTVLNSISGTGNRIVLFEDIDSAFANKEELTHQFRNKYSKNDNIGRDKDDENMDKYNVVRKDKNVNIDKDTNKKSNKYVDVQQQQKFLTYSGLLNALDGVLTSRHGTIVIMTTNYIEKLGKALIRPGRIDFAIELTFCDRHQIIEMTTNMINKSYKIIKNILSHKKKISMLPPNDKKSNKKCLLLDNNQSKDHTFNFAFNNPYDPNELSAKIEKFADLLTDKQIKPCELQVYILKYLDDIEQLFNNYHELINNHQL